MITIPTYDPAAENNFDTSGNLELELTNQFNAADYIGFQKIRNVKLITK